MIDREHMRQRRIRVLTRLMADARRTGDNHAADLYEHCLANVMGVPDDRIKLLLTRRFDKRGTLWDMAMRFAKDDRDAEDLLQDTLRAAWKAWNTASPAYEDIKDLGTWLWVVMRNRWSEVDRQRQRELEALGTRVPFYHEKGGTTFEDHDEEDGTVPHSLESVLAGARGTEPKGPLEDALRALPPHLRNTLRLIYVSGVTQQTAAEIMGCSQAQISRRLREGLALLRDEISSEANISAA